MGRLVAAVAVAGFFLAACGGQPTEEDKALGHALAACEIPTTANGEPVRDESGNVPLPSSTGGKSLNVDSSPVRELEESVDAWKARSAEANAAAQLDPAWQELATTMGDRAAYLSGWLNTRKSGRKPGEAIPTIASDMQRSNGLLAKYETICDGLALRLSDS